MFRILLICILLGAAFAAVASAADGQDSIFTLDLRSESFKKMPADEALNSWATDMQAGALAFDDGSDSHGLYLAFAVDHRYQRDCSGNRRSALCSFLHSGMWISTTNLSWNDGSISSDRYDVIAIPLEYVTGRFSRQGPDVTMPGGAFFVTAGARARYMRDLGLSVENQLVGDMNASVNSATEVMPLGEHSMLRWIGSLRLFVGGSATQFEQTSLKGAFAGGAEAMAGLAIDLDRGSLTLTDANSQEWNWGRFDNSGVGGTANTNCIEIRYLHSVCHDEAHGGCVTPHPINIGGGVRYELSTYSYGTTDTQQNPYDVSRAINRIIFFAELVRF